MIPPVILSKATKLSYGRGIPAVDFPILTGLLDEGESGKLLFPGFRLPFFTRRAKRELASHPKFYLFDTGVFRSLRPRGPLDIPEGMEGQALEGLVAQHLRAWLAYS